MEITPDHPGTSVTVVEARSCIAWLYPEAYDQSESEGMAWYALCPNVSGLNGVGRAYSPRAAFDALREEVDYALATRPDELLWLTGDVYTSNLHLPPAPGEAFGHHVPVLVRVLDDGGYDIHIGGYQPTASGPLTNVSADSFSEAMEMARDVLLTRLVYNEQWHRWVPVADADSPQGSTAFRPLVLEGPLLTHPFNATAAVPDDLITQAPTP